MGNGNAVECGGLEEAPVKLDVSIKGMVEEVSTSCYLARGEPRTDRDFCRLTTPPVLKRGVSRLTNTTM
jgi:hypothetical protein